MKKSTSHNQSSPVALLVGTRPELIKMAPVIREAQLRQINFIFIHSNQHYTSEMDAAILQDLQLPAPDFHLNVGSGSHAVQTGKVMERVEQICLQHKPVLLVVHGDTNTTLGGALSAKKLHIPVAHVEAGLRSFDYRMPEEINRILTDRISDLLFAPNEIARNNLLKEGISDKLITVTGNTVVDALQQHLPLSSTQTILSDIGVQKGQFILMTAHRPENVDSKEQLSRLIRLLNHISERTKLQIIWPMHPRTATRLSEFSIELPNFIRVVPPLGYLNMLRLIEAAQLVLTDSGGIQEEAYILKKPIMTLRNSTERPETLTANFLIHLSSNKFDKAYSAIEAKRLHWGNSCGDGTAAKQIITKIETLL